MANYSFVPGLELSGLFYQEAVKPILDAQFRGLRYSAALIGWGSDVLGLDNPQSMDHMWGPRLLLFLLDADEERLREPIKLALRTHLPNTFRGFPTNFSAPDEAGIQKMEFLAAGPVNHLVRTWTIAMYFKSNLGIDLQNEIGLTDWLTFPEQKLLALTSGRVFHDDLGLEQARSKLLYYPRDVWLYLLACQWVKISQEEAFVGRCGDVGDELGSKIIAARLIQYLMRLCFLMERRYAPYSKWLGSAFARLVNAKKLAPMFQGALSAENWRERESHMAQAYQLVAEDHNALGITPPMETSAVHFFDRPYLVIKAHTFATAIFGAISDEKLRSLPPFGSVDQFADSTDILGNTEPCRKLSVLFA